MPAASCRGEDAEASVSGIADREAIGGQKDEATDHGVGHADFRPRTKTTFRSVRSKSDLTMGNTAMTTALERADAGPTTRGSLSILPPRVLAQGRADAR